MGMVIQDDSKETLLFYEEVVGLIRARHDVETTFESSLAGREIFELQSGEGFVVIVFDDPRSSKTDFQAARSGRVSSIAEYFQRVKASNAQKITEIVANEFGEQSFSFIAPDGYFWTLIESGLQ